MIPAPGTGLVVIAAGESRRMGGRPKALLPAPPDGRPFILRILATAAEAGVAERLVVTRAELRPDLERVVGAQARLVENPRWREGMLTSYQAGVRALLDGPALRGLLLWPVDHPLVRADTLRRLLAAGDRIALPVEAGRTGHPLWLPVEVARDLLELPLTSSARELLTRHAARVVHLPVADPGVVLDVDTAAEHAQLHRPR